MKHPLDLHRDRRTWHGWKQERGLRRRRSSARFGRNELAGTLLAGIVGGLAWTMLPAATSAPAPAAPLAAAATSFGFCHRGGGTNCVVDGDTFEPQRKKGKGAAYAVVAAHVQGVRLIDNMRVA